MPDPNTRFAHQAAGRLPYPEGPGADAGLRDWLADNPQAEICAEVKKKLAAAEGGATEPVRIAGTAARATKEESDGGL